MIHIYKTLLIVVIILFSNNAYSQWAGGNVGGNKPTSTSKTQIKEDVWNKSNSYIAFSLLSPIGDFGDSYETYDIFSESKDIPGQMGNGVELSLGTIKYINGIKLDDRFKVGIDYGGNVSFMANADYSAIYTSLGAHVGGVFSFNPIDELVLDVRVLLRPEIFETYDYEEFQEYEMFSFHKELGFYAKYRAFILGIKWNWGVLDSSEDDYRLKTNKFGFSLGFNW